MGAYTLNPGEVMVLREETAYDHRKSDNDFVKGELLLTTEALVFSKKNLFGKVTDCQVYPVREIQVFNGKPQAKLVSNFGIKNLEVYMANGEVLKFGIGEGFSKGGILKWVNAIYEIITGHEYTEFDKSAYAIPGMQTVANYAGGTIDAFKKSLGFGTKEPEMVVKYCQNCGAQIKGRSGDIGKCEFCGSSQKL